MKLIEKIKIQNRGDTVYAKTTLKNLLKREKNSYDESFFIFVVMELSTNLIKYAGGGEIWILKSDDELLIASLDYGKGIKDTHWARKKGTTSLKNSLGLGFYQISQNPDYNLEIFSLTQREFHGTIVLVKPKKLKKSIVFLQIPYIGEHLNGDLVAKKGKFLIIADGCGHGVKAFKSAEFVKSFFYNNHFSCLLIDEFFQKLHKEIQKNMLRGVVLSIFEITKYEIQSCGVGNISIWHKQHNNLLLINQKDGIIGEVYSSISKNRFVLSDGEKLVATTDGIDNHKVKKISSKIPENISSELLALTLIHFASVEYDDKSVVVIENSEGEKNAYTRI